MTGLWRMKPDVGKHYEDGRVYRPGEVMNHEPSPAGLHKFDCITPPEPLKPRGTAPTLVLVSDGRYNVINAKTGKPINDKPLPFEEAVTLGDGSEEGKA